MYHEGCDRPFRPRPRSCVQKTTSPARLRGTKWECGEKKRGSNDRYVSQTERTSRTASRRNPRQDIAPKDSLRSTIQIWRYVAAKIPAHPLNYSNHAWPDKSTNLILFYVATLEIKYASVIYIDIISVWILWHKCDYKTTCIKIIRNRLRNVRSVEQLHYRKDNFANAQLQNARTIISE